MKALLYLIAGAMVAGTAFAKLPPAPPVDPAKAEEAKQKAAETKKKGDELQAKYEDKAVSNYAAKAKAEGKAFKPSLGAGVPPAPTPAPAAAPVSAAAAATAAKPAPVGSAPLAAASPVKK